MCGWAVQTVLLDRELRRRGHFAAVLNVNESRKIKSPNYIDVQSGPDFFRKVVKLIFRGYSIHAHLNAESPKLYCMDLFALALARLTARDALLTFHGGLPQKFFPTERPRWMRWAFQVIFRVADRITCDNQGMKRAIVEYGIDADKISPIPCFSAELLEFEPTTLAPEVEGFLGSRSPVFLCYVSFRPEYRLETLRAAMCRFRKSFPKAGFIWLGFPSKEMAAARDYISTFDLEERDSLLLQGNLAHDAFLTLLSRCYGCIRTPACDGVSSSVLESLHLGVPVVASENGRRPAGVLTYPEHDAALLCSQLLYLTANYEAVKSKTTLQNADSNTDHMADWIEGRSERQSLRQVSRAV